MIRFLLKISALSLILLGIYVAVVAYLSGFALLHDLSDFDHMPELRKLFASGEYEQVLSLGNDLKNAKWYSNANELDALIRASEKESGAWDKYGVRFLRGFISGNSASSADAAGAIVSDLFIYGDVRDIFVQTGLFATGQDGDKTLLAISGAGLLLEMLPVANWLPAAIKYLHKTGSLTDEFSQSITASLKNLKQYGKLDNLERNLFINLHKLFCNCGLRRTGQIMKFIRTPEQLVVACKISEREPEILYLAVKATYGEILEGKIVASPSKLISAARKGRPGLLTLKKRPMLAAIKIISSGRAGSFIRLTSRQNSIFRIMHYTFSAMLITAGIILFRLARQKNDKKNLK